MTADAPSGVLTMSERVTAVPVVHGSADFALALRDMVLSQKWQCLAVPLPPSFEEPVMEAVGRLPEIHAVVQRCAEDDDVFSYVPIDPCQPVIRALRMARQERIPIVFIDLETAGFLSEGEFYPDPYALKKVSLEQFATALIPHVPAPEEGSLRDRRIRHMAHELRKLELDYERILFPCSIVEWPWLRDAFVHLAPYPKEPAFFAPVEVHRVDPRTLSFFLSELPWITWLYERLRHGFEEEQSLGVDGVKELLLEVRDRIVVRRKALEGRLTLTTMRLFLQYVRNLMLVRRRLRPDLITLIEAAKQVFGDTVAIELLETSGEYPPQKMSDEPEMRMSPEGADLPHHGMVRLENRLPGQRLQWRSIDLRPEPEESAKQRWQQVWNPFAQCSWPPEDARIESFNTHVREQAKNLLSSDLARVEKFTSSLKDGLDIRETLRNWHTGELYVREMPPARGSIEIVVFLFDTPADPDTYQWRTTWFAEHDDESTLVFYATSYMDDMVGPGIGQARYGGAFFLFPPRPILDIWRDPRLEFATTLEERLLAGAFINSRDRHVAVVSPGPLRASWRSLARRYGKVPIHLPLSRFSASMVDRLRTFHVLNGHEVRSYAADFIRGTE